MRPIYKHSNVSPHCLRNITKYRETFTTQQKSSHTLTIHSVYFNYYKPILKIATSGDDMFTFRARSKKRMGCKYFKCCVLLSLHGE